jgi:hypothetical protein
LMVFGGSWIAKPSATATPACSLITSSSFIHQGRPRATSLRKDSNGRRPPRRYTCRSCSHGSGEAVPTRPGLHCMRPCDGSATTVAGIKPGNPYLRSSYQDDQRFVDGRTEWCGAKKGMKLSASQGGVGGSVKRLIGDHRSVTRGLGDPASN